MSNRGSVCSTMQDSSDPCRGAPAPIGSGSPSFESAPASSRAILRQALASAGLLLELADYNQARRQVEVMGAQTLGQVRELVEDRSGHRVAGIYREADYVRVLGFGAALTRYFTSPWTGRTAGPIVVRLGALCNLVVSLFDHLLDSRDADAETTLGAQVLKDLAHPVERALLLREPPQSSADAQLLRALVAQYFIELERLDGSPWSNHVRRQVTRCIHRMYSAEKIAAQRCGRLSALVALRVAAFPFLVMALPAWMEVPEGRSALMPEHARWVLRFGRFIGWVDDFEDLEYDLVARQYNRVHASGQRWSQSSLAQRVVDEGRALDAQRMRREADREDSLHAQLLPLLLTSWLGGPALPATECAEASKSAVARESEAFAQRTSMKLAPLAIGREPQAVQGLHFNPRR